jgi:hypothetical protein
MFFSRQNDLIFLFLNARIAQSDQLHEMRKVNFARIICENSDSIDYIQKNVFRGESKHNPIVACKSLPDMDLSAWRDNKGTAFFSCFRLIRLNRTIIAFWCISLYR